MYFRNYGLRNTWLDKCLKSPASEYPLTSNIVNCPKQTLLRSAREHLYHVTDHCVRS